MNGETGGGKKSGSGRPKNVSKAPAKQADAWAAGFCQAVQSGEEQVGKESGGDA